MNRSTFFFPLFLLFFLLACSNGGQDTAAGVDVTDTMPPIKEIDGLDNQEGYQTRQMSTEYDKDLAIVDTTGIFEVVRSGQVVESQGAVLSFSPERYTFVVLEKALLTDAQKAALAGKPVSVKDRPPLFSASCQTAQVPLDCANEALLDYFRNTPGMEGKAYVTFLLNGLGTLERIESLHLSQTDCESCAEALKKRIREMPAWLPALINGEPAKARIRVPVL